MREAEKENSLGRTWTSEGERTGAVVVAERRAGRGESEADAEGREEVGGESAAGGVKWKGSCCAAVACRSLRR
eukprot:4211831-Pleurochrysis_carterae.AAC.3